METLLEQLLTILIYAPIPVAILWLLLGAAFSKANHTTQSPPSPAQPNQQEPPLP